MTLILALLITGGMVPLEKTVALVGESPVLHSQVMDLLTGTDFGETGGDFQALTSTAGYRQALEELVENRLLVQAGIEAGYYPTEDEIRALVEEELENDPRLASIDREYLASYLADDRSAQIFLGRKVQEAINNMSVSPETFLSASAELVEELVMPRRVGWIYLPVLPSGPEYHEAVDEMLELRSRIMAGESFEELAMQYSDDGSAAAGGYLGTFGPGEMTYAFEEAAFSLEPGEVSQPVATSFGVHLIRLESRGEDGTVTASHILRLVEVDSADVENTLMRAEDIIREMEVSGMSFEEAAARYSMDRSSADLGGDMGIVPLKLWIPEIAREVEDLEPGGISGPVLLEETGGVAIIRLQEGSGDVDWSSYSSREINNLVQQVIYQDTYRSVVDSLRRRIPVVYLLEDADAVED
ncbi:MAG: peptidylprolyl isomerase [Candidatus Aegiribacteria sp.]